MNMYVTYLTTYSGNKLPPFYIGSTSLNKVNNGYRGSVISKRYKTIWKEEITNNPHLFKTVIISTHDTREEALQKELILQTKLNVVRSPMYINMALATVNGFVGISLIGNQHRKGIPCTEEQKQAMSIIKKGCSRRGVPMSAEGKLNISKGRKGIIPIKKECPHCHKIVDRGNYAKHHGDKCKAISPGPPTHTNPLRCSPRRMPPNP